MRKAWGLTWLLCVGCGTGVPELNVFYLDELVEAPTRTIVMRGVSGAESCDDVLTRGFNELTEGQSLLYEVTERYPIDPMMDHFTEAPLDERFALDIAGFDESLLQISRACVMVDLRSAEASIDVEMRALPLCSSNVLSSSLDVLIAIDTSANAILADPESNHLDFIRQHLLVQPNLPLNTNFSILTFGHQDSVQEILPPTTSSTDAIEALNTLYSVQDGPERLYDGITKATALLRSRAVCGRVPAIVLVAGNGDQMSTNRFEDASVGLFAVPGDEDDDIFSASVALSIPAYDTLDRLIPEGYGEITGGETRDRLSLAFVEVRGWLNALLLPDEEPPQ